MALMRKGTSVAMATANRANALKSTGPVTVRGQSISRLNAAKHWGRAETIRPMLAGLGKLYGLGRHANAISSAIQEG